MKRSGTLFWKTLGTRVFSDNVVFVQAVGLSPILSAGTTLKYGVTLSACMALVLMLTALLSSTVGWKLPAWLRPPLYVAASGLCLTGASAILNAWISTEVYAALYLFLPLLALNTIYFSHYGTEAEHRPAYAFSEAACASVGFGTVVCVISALRELLAFNTLWGESIEMQVTLPQTTWPFAALILLSLMAALLQWLRQRFAKREVSDRE